MALLGRVFLRIRQPVYAQSHLPAKAHERYFAGASHPWYVCKRPRGTLRIPERLEEKMGERALAFLDGREKCTRDQSTYKCARRAWASHLSAHSHTSAAMP